MRNRAHAETPAAAKHGKAAHGKAQGKARPSGHTLKEDLHGRKTMDHINNPDEIPTQKKTR